MLPSETSSNRKTEVNFNTVENFVTRALSSLNVPTIPTSFQTYNSRIFCLFQKSILVRANTIFEVTINPDESIQWLDVLASFQQEQSSQVNTTLSEAQKLIIERSRQNSTGVISLNIDSDTGDGIFSMGGALFYFDLNEKTGVTSVDVVDVDQNQLNPKFIGNSLLDPKLTKLKSGNTGIFYVKNDELFLSSLIKVGGNTTASESQLTNFRASVPPPFKLLVAQPSFVIQEEFDRYTGYDVSPDGDKVLIEISDETEVERHNVDGEWFMYPRAGTKNASQTLALKHLFTSNEDEGFIDRTEFILKYEVLLNSFPWFEYMPRFGWLSNEVIWFEIMNRHQKRRAIILTNTDSFTKNPLNPLFCTIFDHEFINEPYWHSTDYGMKPVDATCFIYSNETSGFRHLYLQYFDSQNLQVTRPPIQLTSGDWEVGDGKDSVKFCKNPKNDKLEKVYFVGKRDSPLCDHLYEVAINYENSSSDVTRITELGYSYRDFKLEFNSNGDLDNFVAVRSNLDTPHCPFFKKINEISVRSSPNSFITSPSIIKLLNFQPLTDQPLPKPFTFTNSSNTELHGLIYTPTNYDQNSDKKYPVLWYVYGGPGVQLVTHEFKGQAHMRFKVLAQLGYFVIMVDNQGSIGRGLKFQSPLYHKFGQIELQDQVETLEHICQDTLFSKNIDKNRIAIFGWSYGGYMSLLALAERPDIFKLAFCGAAPTDWTLYDTAYTERYMDTPQNNPMGYISSSVLHRASKFPDETHRLFLFHGLRDDNVYFENTKRLIQELQAQGKPYELQMYPTERHGLRSISSYRHNLVYIVSCLEQFL